MGLQRAVNNQVINFGMMTTAGAPDAAATVTVRISVDNGTQYVGVGTITNKGNGQYTYVASQADTNGVNIGFMFTATGDQPTFLNYFTDPPNFGNLVVDGLGNVSVTSTFKKGIARPGFMFPMTDSTTHQLKSGIVFTAAGSIRSIDGLPAASTTNLPVEVGGGIYAINLSAADLNGNNIIFTWVMSGTDPTIIEIPTQP